MFLHFHDITLKERTIFLGTPLEKKPLTATTESTPHPQSKSTRILVLEIAEPLGGDEGHCSDDGVAYGEYHPQDTDGLRVPDIIRRVHVRRFNVLHFGTHVVVVVV